MKKMMQAHKKAKLRRETINTHEKRKDDKGQGSGR